jgi:hypothetical protein
MIYRFFQKICRAIEEILIIWGENHPFKNQHSKPARRRKIREIESSSKKPQRFIISFCFNSMDCSDMIGGKLNGAKVLSKNKK